MRAILTSMILLAASGCFANAADNCAADPSWIEQDAPPPNFGEPPRGNDCQFYRDSWQLFLYSMQMMPGSTPGAAKLRFSKYTNYVQLFGADAAAGFAKPMSGMLDLAPRLEKADDPLEAADMQQAGSNALLIDKNGRIVFYSINIDPIYEAFVRKYSLNDPYKLRKASPNLEFPTGSVEYKAAWQVVDEPLPLDRFLVTDASIPTLISNGNGGLKVDPTAPLRRAKVALLSLHVVFRPENHPEFVWATFENKFVAPNAKTDPQPDKVQDIDEKYPGEYVLFKGGTKPEDANKKVTNITVLDQQKQLFAPSTPIFRVFPFASVAAGNADGDLEEEDEAVSQINDSARTILDKSTLANYRLVGAVWLDDPRNPNDRRGFVPDRSFSDLEFGGENHLSNMAMESFTQSNNTGCFSCHDTTSKGGIPASRIAVSHLLSRFYKNSKP